MKFVKKNDVVEIVSISTSCTLAENKKIKNFIKKIGLKPNIFLEKQLTLAKSNTHELPAFSVEKRFEQFKKAVESEAKIIWCARGGYGTAELLPFLEEIKKPKQQKIFIGFSDISALNNFLIEKWDWQVIAAPMLAQIVLNKVSKKSTQAIIDLIFGKTTDLKYSLKPLIKAEKNIHTFVVGGCLSVIAAQFGTKNQIDWNNKILFLEDEGETGERLDRYFYQIVQIISEQKKIPKAIILGNFLQANPHGTPKAKNIAMAIKKFAEKLQKMNLGIPLFQEKSKSLGHSTDMMPLILGRDSQIIENSLIQKLF